MNIHMNVLVELVNINMNVLVEFVNISIKELGSLFDYVKLLVQYIIRNSTRFVDVGAANVN